MNRKLFVLSAIFFGMVVCSHSQSINYTLHTSFVKFDIDQYNPGAKLFPENYYNGFEIGGNGSYKPTGTPFLFQSGLIFTHLNYEYFDLNYVVVPLKFNIEIGKRAGVFLGPGFRLWYLLIVPDNPYKYDYNRFLYSWNARLGVFFEIKNIKFQLYPQLEFVKTPVYTTGSWSGGEIDYKLFMTSYNLSICF